MSSFTFAKGNATKLLSAPLYALGALATAAVPRRRDLWVFGCGSGVGEGALALYRLAEAAEPTVRHVWLAGSLHELEQAQAAGLTAALRSSWRGFRLTLRARVLVVTHGFGDVNRFGTRGAFVVQLWHGIPLKKIQLDSPVTFHSRLLPSALLRWLYRRQSARIALMPAASEVAAGRLRTAFGLPEERVVVTGDPRDDSVVAVRAADDARKLLAAILGSAAEGNWAEGDRVLLYAPTWRDGEPDPGVPSEKEWEAIAGFLSSSSSILLLRPHPHGIGAYGAGPAASQRIRMLSSRDAPDLNPLLPCVDLLITDFSSVAFDFALTGRPIAFLAPDLDHYSATRGLYGSYSEFSGGAEETTWADLLAQISDEPTVSQLAAHSKALAVTHHRYRDGQSTSRVFDQISTRLGATE